MIESVLLICLAWNVYFEARNEPIIGQHAVAEVTITRGGLSGRNICEEVFLDRQFSWNNGDVHPIVRNKRAWKIALQIAQETLANPTFYAKGATHYHATYIKKPKWATRLCEVARIGRHIFYKQCEVRHAMQ